MKPVSPSTDDEGDDVRCLPCEQRSRTDPPDKITLAVAALSAPTRRSDDSEDQQGPEESSEEHRAIRLMRSPCGPTREEVEQHNLTHAQFRSWCPACVRGRGKNSPHYPVERDAEAIPIQSFDYCFLGSGRSQLEEANAEAAGLSPVLVMHDDATKAHSRMPFHTKELSMRPRT